jgi:hypothetical protein
MDAYSDLRYPHPITTADRRAADRQERKKLRAEKAEPNG